jgi:glycosyltransferase involved in cell wall biosynthesis
LAAQLSTKKRKPRVAFFIDEWRPGSGTENQLQGLLSCLSPDHVDAHLFTLRKPIAPEHRSLFPCPVECLYVGGLVRPRALFQLPGIAARLRREKFDLAMIYFVDSNFYMVPACRLAGIPELVINRRDMGYWYEPSVLRKLNFVNRWATHFLVNAEAVKNQVVGNEQVAAEQITVIPNGMWDLEHRRRLQNSSLTDPPPGFPAGGLVVGVTASLRQVKRIDRFLEMASKVLESVPEVHFVIAGQGELRASLLGQASELGIADRVVFLGQVADVPGLLQRLHVGVLTSESEGLSNSLVEYGLAGVPAVTFDVGGNAEVVKEGETGFLVPPGDTDAMADRVIQLLIDNGRHEEMSGNAKAHCASTFAPERIRNLTLEFFRSLID